ncbi:MAG: hypothetical protein HXY43_07440 [Fischerella sp.]|jgi:hypothetical protein|nr:hypothetical protein [Fischerella sp.]NWF59132.1 hypothetical protein [Fischerella sp.]
MTAASEESDLCSCHCHSLTRFSTTTAHISTSFHLSIIAEAMPVGKPLRVYAIFRTARANFRWSDKYLLLMKYKDFILISFLYA